GSQTISFGGIAIGTSLVNGDQTILSGGTASNTALVGINAGNGFGPGSVHQIVSSGGLAISTNIGAVVNGTAFQILDGGTAIDTTIAATGGGYSPVVVQMISSGGVAISTTLVASDNYANAYQTIFSGGVAS